MPATQSVPPSVAAGSPSAADVGAELLRRGGSAADAAVAMVLASCAAETVYTGLGGGGFAIFHEPASSSTNDSTTCVDFFVSAPGLDGTPLPAAEQISVDFGAQVVPYAVGPATVAVPGVPAGLAAVHERWGLLPWAEVVEPARALAESGVVCGPAQARILTTVAAAMLRGEGVTAYAPGGTVLEEHGLLFHPGLARSFERLRDAGPDDFYRGEIAAAIVASVAGGSALSETDLLAYRVVESAPRTAELAGHVVAARGDDLDDLLGLLSSLDQVLAGDPSSGELALALVDLLRAPPRRSDTSNVVAVDAAGRACSITTSLGLSSGIWVPGFGLHLNSMLGEGELLRGGLVPGRRMGSMMSPLVLVDEVGLRLVGGAAGGSRIRSALAQVLLRVVRDRLPVADAIVAPRLNAVPDRVHVEPGMSDNVLRALTAREPVTGWPGLDAYFGGVSAVDRHGPGADPRRDGATRTVRAR